MPKHKPRTPKYRHYKPKNLAVVRINGRDHYLGRYESPESIERYDRLIAEWLVSRHQPSARAGANARTASSLITVNELLLAFIQYAKQRYVKNGEPTSEIRSYRTALRPVRRLYGHEPVTNFGPLALVACRQQLIDGDICRKRINGHVGRIRHMFKWGVARELVPEAVWRALCAVEGLRRGDAKETKAKKPVPEEHIAPIEPFVTPQIWAMVNLQLWSGCRPGEACDIRGIDLKMTGKVWEYVPGSHKTEHHEKERVIFLGPHAQSVIKPWLKTDLTAYLFSPREARAWFDAQRKKNRRTHESPSHREKRKGLPGDQYNGRYSTNSFDQAIERASERAGVPKWSPGRLRHNAATRIRAAYGIEATRIILGHASAVTSEIYA